MTMRRRFPNRLRRGFTLVELLVVVAIIAVLASMGFAGAKAAINNARKVKARKMCVAMDTAVLAFYDEYGHLPAMTGIDTDKEFVTDSGDGVTLVTILMGYESESATIENRKRVRYLDAPEAKGRRDGVVYRGSGDQVEGLFDPWGGPYRVLLDGDYNEQLDNPFRGAGNPSVLRGKRVVTYTFGANKINDQGGRDDVASWK